MTSSLPDLTDRASHLLKTLINEYIQDGSPIGSTRLARSSGLSLSAATIRNAMAHLEDLGLIRSPHTSAGRIPTSKGYRLFVDSLLKVQPLNADLLHVMNNSFHANQNSGALIQSASTLLSGVTKMAGIVTLQRHGEVLIKHLEFLRLSSTQILAILVMENGDIQNRLLEVDRAYDSNELQHTTNFLNDLLVGKSLQGARESLIAEMKQLQVDVNDFMRSCIELGGQAFAGDESQDDCVIAGETNLVSYDDLADMGKLRDLFNAFNDKQEMLQLLDGTLRAEGVQIFIGRESGHDVFDDLSVVTASYQMQGHNVGVLGVIGPKRMQYERVIPVVDVTARLLSASLKSD